MNSYHLRCFLEVAETLNITQASEKLYMSQQNLSSHIARLEQELGIKLFERRPSLRLTEAGELTLKTARKLLKEEDQLSQKLADITQECRTRLRIGSTHARGFMLLTEVLPEFHRRSPQTDIKIRLGDHKTLQEALERGELDVVVSMRDETETPDYLRLESVHRTAICLMAPLETVQALAPELLPADIGGDPIITAPAESIGRLAEADFLLHHENNVIRDLANRYFEKHDLQPHVLLEVNNLEMLHEFCFNGMGVAFSFEYYARKWLMNKGAAADGRRFVVIPLAEPSMENEFVLAYNSRFYFSKPMKVFLETARAHFD